MLRLSPKRINVPLGILGLLRQKVAFQKQSNPIVSCAFSDFSRTLFQGLSERSDVRACRFAIERQVAICRSLFWRNEPALREYVSPIVSPQEFAISLRSKRIPTRVAVA